jgi:hypothetical protein
LSAPQVYKEALVPMLRRSLKLLAIVAATALLLTVGYAALALRGPAEALAEAEAMAARGQPAAAIALLDLTERSRSLQQDAKQRQHLRRLRYQCNVQLANAAAALHDLEDLLADRATAGDATLQLDRIRLLAAVGDGPTALQHARTFLQANPGHGRCLELAGEACQTVYRDPLRTIAQTLQREVGSLQAPRAQETLLAYLYRPEADPEVAQSLETLRQIHTADTRLLASWQALLPQLRKLRAQVQEALQFFAQSLEAPGEPVAAFRGLALALDQAHRTDDLLLLCEGYRRRFRHQYVLEAGVIAAWTHLRAGEPAAALAAGERWLPLAELDARLAAGLGPAAGDLAVARAVAAWRLQDLRTLDQLASATRRMVAAGLRVPLAHHLTSGLLQWSRKDVKNADPNLRIAVELLLRTPVAVGQQDLVPEFLPLRLQVLQARSAAEGDYVALFADWTKARPGETAPLLAYAAFQREHGRAIAAMTTLANAAALGGADEAVVAERLLTARALHRDSAQDGPGLLAQCLQRGTTRPDVTDPIAYLLCGEAALAKDLPVIARDCARAAADAYPGARQPRRLEIEAELAAGQTEAAARLAHRLLDLLPPDAATLDLALRTHRAARLPTRPLLATAMRIALPNPSLHAELLRTAADAEPAVAEALARKALRDPAATVEVKVLAAATLARLGHTDEAMVLLAQVATTTTPGVIDDADLGSAVCAWLQARAGVEPDPALAPAATRAIERFLIARPAATAPLLATAQALAATHPATAYAVCAHALAVAAPAGRTGAGYELAGRLAATLGQHQLAEQHWLAALAFPDGRSAVEPLARACFAADRSERAQQVYRLVEAPTDAALAARCGNTTSARKLATTALAADGADLLAQAVLALLGDQSPLALQPNDEPDAQLGLELVSLLPAPTLATTALAKARALVGAHPESPGARLLLARALLAAGAPGDALGVHADLVARGVNLPALWRELALATDVPGYTLPVPLRDAIGAAVATGKVAGSPRVLAFGLQAAAAAMDAAQQPGLAAGFRTQLWLQHTALARPSIDDALGTAANGNPLDAWWILQRLRPTLTGPERRRCLQAQCTLTDRLLRLGVPEGELLYRDLLQLATDEGPYGRIAHALLDHGARFAALRPTPVRTRALLQGHLLLVGGGHEPADLLPATVERLVELAGPEAALADIDAALVQQPISLPLWRVRAERMARLQRAAQGIADLRAALAHGETTAERLACAILAAGEHATVPADQEALAALPAVAKAGPTGALAQGLVLLRLGQPDAALAAFTPAVTSDTGVHLVAKALALLQSRDEDGAARAAALLDELATAFATSPHARHARSLARQLAQTATEPQPPTGNPRSADGAAPGAKPPANQGKSGADGTTGAAGAGKPAGSSSPSQKAAVPPDAGTTKPAAPKPGAGPAPATGAKPASKPPTKPPAKPAPAPPAGQPGGRAPN